MYCTKSYQSYHYVSRDQAPPSTFLATKLLPLSYVSRDQSSRSQLCFFATNLLPLSYVSRHQHPPYPTPPLNPTPQRCLTASNLLFLKRSLASSKNRGERSTKFGTVQRMFGCLGDTLIPYRGPGVGPCPAAASSAGDENKTTLTLFGSTITGGRASWSLMLELMRRHAT